VKVVLGARKCDRVVVSKHLNCDRCELLTLAGLPGIIEEPGSFSGS
jgi:hypothetical protein